MRACVTLYLECICRHTYAIKLTVHDDHFERIQCFFFTFLLSSLAFQPVNILVVVFLRFAFSQWISVCSIHALLFCPLFPFHQRLFVSRYAQLITSKMYNSRLCTSARDRFLALNILFSIHWIHMKYDLLH